MTNWPFTSTTDGQQFFIGNEALHLPVGSRFELFRPIVRGRFASNPRHCMRKVVDSLEKIINYILKMKLNINQQSLKNCTIVFVIPDEFSCREISSLYSLVLRNIGVGACVCHQESVLACFGAGLSSACVVDIGKQKTRVSCIRDGTIIDGASKTASYGGDDVTKLLHVLLREFSSDGEHVFPQVKRDNENACFFDLQNPQYWTAIDVLKKQMCQLPPVAAEDARLGQAFTFGVRTFTKAFQIGFNITQARYLAPQAFFLPNLFGREVYSCCQYIHPLHFLEDNITQEDYLTKEALEHAPALAGRVKDRRGEKLIVESAGKSSITLLDSARSVQRLGFNVHNDDECMEQADNIRECEAPSSIPSLVSQCFSAIDDSEFQRFLASQFLLVGGSAHLPRLIDEFEDKVLDELASYLLESDKVEVVQIPLTLGDASSISWKGAAIIATSEGMKGCCVSNAEWVDGSAQGLHLLRTRLPFAWE